MKFWRYGIFTINILNFIISSLFLTYVLRLFVEYKAWTVAQSLKLNASSTDIAHDLFHLNWAFYCLPRSKLHLTSCLRCFRKYLQHYYVHQYIKGQCLKTFPLYDLTYFYHTEISFGVAFANL